MRSRINDRFIYPKVKGLAFPADDPKSASMAQQSFAAECDIHKIVAKYKKTGVLPVSMGVPIYGDFSGVGTYHDALNRIKKANEEFLKIPSKIRDRFHNDVGEFLAFMGDEKNLDEAIKLGLVKEPKVDTHKAEKAAEKAADQSGT